MRCKKPSAAPSLCPTDESLVARAQAGDPRAIERLLTRYRGLVEAKGRAYFLSGADYEDIVQEGMIGLAQAVRDFRPGRSPRFRPFAEVCIARRIISAVRAATRHKHDPLRAALSLDGPVAPLDDGDAGRRTLLDCLPDPRADDPAGWLLRRAQDEALRRAVATLSPLERSVLNHILIGDTYRQTAAALACGPKAVDNALQRIRRKFAERALEPLACPL